MNQRFATSDAEGRFAFDHVVPGTWQVMHFALDRLRDAPEGDADVSDFTEMFSDMKLASAEVVEGEETHVVLGAPPKDPVLVRGRVHAAGQGVPRAVVTFLADGGKGMEHLKFTTTDGEGRYSVQLVAPGGYIVSVQKVGLAGEQQTVSHSVTVPEREEFEHDVALPLGSIRGTVRDPDGEPAKGARVSLAVEGAVPNAALLGRHFAEISTDDAGRYELVWLEPGRYTVSVGGAAFGGMFGEGGASYGRQLRSGIEVGADEGVDGIDFKLRKPGRIEGLVRGSDGKPVAEAAIFLRDGAGRVLERFSMIATDGSGRFAYDGLEPGEYVVLARSATETSGESAPVRVREDGTAEVELTLGPGTMLLVTLSDDEGNPIECSVSVTDEHGRQVNGMLSLTEVMQAFSSGQFSSKEQRVGPLPPGKYKVQVTTEDGRSTTKPVNLTGQAERKLNVRF
jgi:protocatechuate 3,4-dioxygenase beta subunit